MSNTEFWQPIAEKVGLQARILALKDAEIEILKLINKAQEELEKLEKQNDKANR